MYLSEQMRKRGVKLRERNALPIAPLSDETLAKMGRSRPAQQARDAT
jgi:hypothetical protein